MSKNSVIDSFDPNGLAADNGNIYGLPFSPEDATMVIVPVPWEGTVSYKGGTAKGPKAVLEASKQVDLFDPYVTDAWRLGLAMDKINKKIYQLSKDIRPKVEAYLDKYAAGKDVNTSKSMKATSEEVHEACEHMIDWVEARTTKWLDMGKKVALLGGDHSTPLGFIKALSMKHKSFGILQIDAHADLRDAYEGFTYSHASIMTNALKVKQVSKLVQVGIRDFCEEELAMIHSDQKRIKTFFDHEMKDQMAEGKTWADICKEIVAACPDKVYLSFDIDGLDPKLCPNTGTPVPGGLEYDQVLYLVRAVLNAGKSIIGFDINEISPGQDEWDANVGARMLYRISNLVMNAK